MYRNLPKMNDNEVKEINNKKLLLHMYVSDYFPYTSLRLKLILNLPN